MIGCKLIQSTGQLFPNDAGLTPVPITFPNVADREFITDPAMHNFTNSDRLYAPVTGLWEVSLFFTPPTLTAGQKASVWLERYIGGVTTSYQLAITDVSGVGPTIDFSTDEMTTSVSDYFALRYAQAGASFTSPVGGCWFSILKVG